MGNYGHEIPDEENDSMLASIDIYFEPCPICKRNPVNRTDWEYSPTEFNTQRRIYFCKGCGVIAREKHSW